LSIVGAVRLLDADAADTLNNTVAAAASRNKEDRMLMLRSSSFENDDRAGYCLRRR
jgi:hypothetical protein